MKDSWGLHGRHTVKSAIERFMSKTKVNGNGCWIWTGVIGSHKRYGTCGLMGKNMLAHRASWTLFRGEIGDLFVLHRCDNGFCVNPDHLFLGTQKDNVLDMENKLRSRHPRRDEHGRAKLTSAKVEQAKTRHKNGELIKDLALEFGVHRRTMSLAISGRSWTTTYSR